MKRRSRQTLLALAVASLFAAPADAVRLDEGGAGQALIFPYYTTRAVQGASLNTLISIVNHSFEVKALRVSFREATTGRVALALNLFVASNDTWTAALAPSGPGTNAAQRLFSNDASCADPAIPAAGLPFLELQEANAREGYVEVIEMATLTGTSAAMVTHVGSTGLPINCGYVQGNPTLTLSAPTGGLSGTATLINVNDGLDFGMNAEALAELSTLPFFRPVTDPYPGFLATEITPVSVVNANGKVYRANWTSGANAIWAVLARREGLGEFVLDAATQSRTDMVVTFPLRPYTPGTDGGQFTLDYRDREGRGQSAIPCEGPFAPNCSANWTLVANVATFDGGLPHTQDDVGILASTNGALVTTSGGGFNQPPITTRTTRIRLGDGPVSNGSFSWKTSPLWTTLTSEPTSQVIDTATGQVTTGTQTYVGMAAVGFTLRTFRNGNLSCGTATCQGNYGGSFPLKFRRDIATP